MCQFNPTYCKFSNKPKYRVIHNGTAIAEELAASK
jgi:hypothetical protein